MRNMERTRGSPWLSSASQMSLLAKEMTRSNNIAAFMGWSRASLGTCKKWQLSCSSLKTVAFGTLPLFHEGHTHTHKKEYWCSSTLFCLISWWYERSKIRGPHPPSVLYSCPTILIKTTTYTRFEFCQMTQLGKMGKRSRKVLCSQMNLTRIEKNKENEICCNYFLSILLLQLNIFFMITMSVAGFARD